LPSSRRISTWPKVRKPLSDHCSTAQLSGQQKGIKRTRAWSVSLMSLSWL